MRFTGIAFLSVAAILAGSPSFADVGSGVHACHTTGDPLRQVVAAGTIERGDRFSGSVRELSDDPGFSYPEGVWVHSSGGRERFIGTVNRLVGESNGAFLITIQGTGRFDGVEGYDFQVVIQHFEDGSRMDSYRIVVVDRSVPEVVFNAVGNVVTGDVIAICE